METVKTLIHKGTNHPTSGRGQGRELFGEVSYSLLVFGGLLHNSMLQPDHQVTPLNEGCTEDGSGGQASCNNDQINCYQGLRAPLLEEKQGI